MADKKIIQLTALTVQASSDLYEVSANGTGSFKETRSQQLSYVNANAVITIGQVTGLTAALASKLNLSGGTMTGAINMGGSQINNMANPTLAQDSATKFYVDSQTFVSPLTTKGDIFGFSTVNARIPIGTDGQVLTADSTQVLGLKWATNASGDVVGPASATNNALVRFDTTTGKLIKNSTAILSNTGDLLISTLEIGTGHTRSGSSNIIFGTTNTISGNNSLVGGEISSATGGTDSFAFGNNCIVTGSNAWAIGANATSSNTGQFVGVFSYGVEFHASTTTGYSVMPGATNAPNGSLSNNDISAAVASSTSINFKFRDNGGSIQNIVLTAGGATGDVVGPASATNEALARYNGTTGKIIKDSSVVNPTGIGGLLVNNPVSPVTAYHFAKNVTFLGGMVWDASTGPTAGSLADGEMTMITQANKVLLNWKVGVTPYTTAIPVLTDGQLIIGFTGSTPVAAVPTAGSGITITPGPGTLTISASGGGMTTVEVTGTSVTMAVNTRFVLNNASLVTATLPATFSVGDVIEVIGKGAGGWKVQANGGQTIHSSFGDTTSGGSLSSTNRYDCLDVVGLTANTDLVASSMVGTLTNA